MLNGFTLGQRVLAEALGTMFLLIAVVGSGIMAVRLSGGNDGVALVANALATGGALIALISVFGSISGAHFNPVVTLFDAVRGDARRQDAIPYILAQIAGAFAGVAIAHVMFALPVAQVSLHFRDTSGEFLGEVIATLGLLLTIWGTRRAQPGSVPFAVAAYIVGAYWFTSSTSFANPAVTLARAMTDTFAGIAPTSVAPFVVAQMLGLGLGLAACRFLSPKGQGEPDGKPV